MKNLDLLLAAAGGAVIGAALGILFAPKKGEETRDEILDFIKSKYPGCREKKLNELADKIAEEIKEA